MFSGKGYIIANQVLAYNLGSTLYTPPPIYYFGLFLSPILSGGTGGAEVPTAGTSYTRVVIPNTTDQWSTPNNGVSFNLNQINFPSASLPWGIIVAGALLDAPTGGNIVYYGGLTMAQNVIQGSQAEFLIGSLVIGEVAPQ